MYRSWSALLLRIPAFTGVESLMVSHFIIGLILFGFKAQKCVSPCIILDSKKSIDII